MDSINKDILEQYETLQPTYLKIEEIVLKELNDTVSNLNIMVNSVESRIKSLDSLKGKLDLKGYKYQSIYDITDIFAARIVTFYMDDVDKYAAFIESSFDIDWENSIDKRKQHTVDQFGYSSLHYICRIPKEMYYDKNNEDINNIRFEIQLRSTLQHCWASIDHDIGYKRDIDIPKEYYRSFNRLAGLLEIVDEEFCKLKNEIYEYRRKVKQIVKTGTKLEDVELNGDSFNEYISNTGFNELNKRIATINSMEIEQQSLSSFLFVFKSFGFKTLKDLDQFVMNYSDLAYEFAVRQFAGKDVGIITTVTGPLTLCVVYILSKNLGESFVKILLDTIYGKIKVNEKIAKKLTNIGMSMGIVKQSDDNEE